MFTKQDPMRRVVYSLLPIFLWSVWLFGWRSIAIAVAVFIPAILTEFIMEKARNKKVSEAVLVTSMLLVLSMPPAIPLWVAMIAAVFAVLMGKEVYGGFGRNIFNPAITGRMFTYISFPLLMQTTWMIPGAFGMNGMNNQVSGSTWVEVAFVVPLLLLVWFFLTRSTLSTKKTVAIIGTGTAVLLALYVASAYAGFRGGSQVEMDVLATATPLELMRGLGAGWNPPENLGWLKENSLLMLFLGMRAGAIGEGPVFLILAAALYLLWNKTANWKLMVSSFLSALVLSVCLYGFGVMDGKLVLMDPAGKTLPGWTSDIAGFMMSGSLLFVCVFMATDPVTAPKKPLAQWCYGLIIGVVTVLVRVYSGFPEGVSFGILMANTFSPLLDEVLPGAKKTLREPAPVPSGGGAS